MVRKSADGESATVLTATVQWRGSVEELGAVEHLCLGREAGGRESRFHFDVLFAALPLLLRPLGKESGEEREQGISCGQQRCLSL